VRGLGAALSVECAALSPVGAVGVVEGTLGALDALVVEGAVGVTPVVSDLPPTLGA
jgi:hypothetical protein